MPGTLEALDGGCSEALSAAKPPRQRPSSGCYEVMAAALLDRLLHRCYMVNIRGNSYRMRRHMVSKAIHPTVSRAVIAQSCPSCRRPPCSVAPVGGGRLLS